MKIGILTITPNIGFGGIMQAYALKYTLEKLGHEVQVLNYTSNITVISRFKYFVRACLKRLQGSYVKYTPESEFRYRSQYVKPFIDRHLGFTRRITNKTDLIDYINTHFEAIVVGSDQVWRPKYVLGIENYYLKDVKPEILKLSYAASFGVNEWEFSSDETAMCANLLQEFMYVSVREKSGVDMVKKNLNYTKEVFCDIDPTLLAGCGAYNQILDQQDKKTLFTYILDPTEDKTLVVDKMMSLTGLDLCKFNTNAENPNKPLNERIAPPVEEWLNGIYNAKFVVTDSFHGCVFSILFNKPFVVYVNKDRGAERFTSILSILGLEERMIYSSFDINSKMTEIDWSKVNIILEDQRQTIINRIKEIL